MARRTRIQYQAELNSLEERALGGIDLVIETLDRTIEALEHHDVELAGLVIADDDRIDGRYLEVHQSILTLLATQAPVATDPKPLALEYAPNAEHIMPGALASAPYAAEAEQVAAAMNTTAVDPATEA